MSGNLAHASHMWNYLLLPLLVTGKQDQTKTEIFNANRNLNVVNNEECFHWLILTFFVLWFVHRARG